MHGGLLGVMGTASARPARKGASHRKSIEKPRPMASIRSQWPTCVRCGKFRQFGHGTETIRFAMPTWKWALASPHFLLRMAGLTREREHLAHRQERCASTNHDANERFLKPLAAEQRFGFQIALVCRPDTAIRLEAKAVSKPAKRNICYVSSSHHFAIIALHLPIPRRSSSTNSCSDSAQRKLAGPWGDRVSALGLLRHERTLSRPFHRRTERFVFCIAFGLPRLLQLLECGLLALRGASSRGLVGWPRGEPRQCVPDPGGGRRSISGG
jgi:hypothetical protein